MQENTKAGQIRIWKTNAQYSLKPADKHSKQ